MHEVRIRKKNTMLLKVSVMVYSANSHRIYVVRWDLVYNQMQRNECANTTAATTATAVEAALTPAKTTKNIVNEMLNERDAI